VLNFFEQRLHESVLFGCGFGNEKFAEDGEENPVDTAHQDAGQSLHRALFYWWQKCLPDAETPFYFSGVTYTSVGYGDLVLPQEWRLLGIGDHTIAGIISPPSGRRLGGFRSFQNEQQSTRPGASFPQSGVPDTSRAPPVAGCRECPDEIGYRARAPSKSASRSRV
jgi:hypothetical protein